MGLFSFSFSYLFCDVLRSSFFVFFFLVVAKDEPEHEEKDTETVKNLVNSAIRDCVAEERNSFVAFQAKTGVEVTLCSYPFTYSSAIFFLCF